ncbi:dentin sialophosphoprotein-like [Schistocerca gregaria]|uniref:dentin sialophosphoprotein-like n=1 Tax=Schistocerca gregaria TaxID=7010 RepID=UPI00211DEE94|nr:dentin sialophosphoprotein-like [Schistocerca gregaria]
MMSDADHNSVYHRKMALLQEKLRKSEEERLKLEEKFSVMMKECKEEEEERLSHLKLQYESFLEEDRKRRDRNDRIMRSLDRIENRAATLNAKSKRLKLLREHYEAYLKRVYPTWKNKSSGFASTRNNHTGHSPVCFDQHNESSYAESFTTPFTTNRRNSVSFSDNLSSSPRLMDISYSPRNFGDTMSPNGFPRYQQRTLDREVTGGKSKFPTNVYDNAAIKKGLEYDHGPNSYIRGMKTEFNNTGTLHDSPNIINGYLGFTGQSAVSNSDIYFSSDTQKFPSTFENRMQNLNDSKTEIHDPRDRLQFLHENNIMGNMERSPSVVNSVKGDLSPVYKKESKDLAAGMAADIDWEQNTSRDLLNMSLTDDGKVSNGPRKAEQLMKHQQNLHVLKMQMEDVKTPVTEDSYAENHDHSKGFLEEHIQTHVKGDLSSDYNKQEEIGTVSPHKTYVQESHDEKDEMDGINSVDNSTDDISIEIGRKIERALSSERETVKPSGSPERQRNLDIIMEESNNTEETHSQTKSMPEKANDFSVNDTELLSGAILTEDDELQYSLSNDTGLKETNEQQIILEEKAVHRTALPVQGEQITSDFKSQSRDLSRGDNHTNFEGNGSEANQGIYESNIQNVNDNLMYLQQPQNVYETVPAYTEDIRQTAYGDYNNGIVNAQDGEQYLQEAPNPEVLAEKYDVPAANLDSGLQPIHTEGGDMNVSGVIFDNTQDQNYIYDTVQNVEDNYNPGGGLSENFYVETYESSDPNFGQQLQPNNVVPDQNWEPYNEMAFQGDRGQDEVQSTYQNFEIQQDVDTQNLQPGEFIYSQEVPGNDPQFYTNNLEQQGAYNQQPGEDQYFYGDGVQAGSVQEDVSGNQLDYITNDAALEQQTYQQPDEGDGGCSPQPDDEPNCVMDKADDGVAISSSQVFDKNQLPDIRVQQKSEQYTENLHAVAIESCEGSRNNSEMQREMLEKQNACNSESVPNTVQDSTNLSDNLETENTRVKGEFCQDPNGMETVLAPSETTDNKSDGETGIEQSPSTTEIAAKKASNDVQGDGRSIDLLNTISEEVKDEIAHTNGSNSFKDDPRNDQHKDIISGHQEVVESNIITKSDEKVSNSGNKREEMNTYSNKEPSDLESAKSVISGEEEFTESFDGGKYHEPTVGYERGIPGYNNAADSSTTEDSSERWTTMPKKTRQQMTLKVQNKKAETSLPPDEDSSDDSEQIQPVLHAPHVRVTSHADTSDDSEQLDNRVTTETQNRTLRGNQKEPLNTGENTSMQGEGKLGRLPARASSKLPVISTVLDSDNESLHLGSESSMT